MVSEAQRILDIISLSIGDTIISTICQSLLYGIYLCLIPIVVHVMVANGLQGRARKLLLAIITSMFTFLTVYWTYSIVFTFLRVDLGTRDIGACFGRGNATACLHHKFTTGAPQALSWVGMFDDILLGNYLIADGIVVWRAWVLCPDQNRVVLMVPVVMLGINIVVYLMTIGFRAALTTSLELPRRILVDLAVEDTQLLHLALSLLINISATSIIALKTWKYRKLLVENGIDIRKPSQALRILAILVESGVIYILITAFVFVPLLISGISVKNPRLSDVIIPVGLQLVGIYPIVVVLLVEKNRSLNSTFCSFGTIIDVDGSRISKMEPMSFAPGRVLLSGGQPEMGLETKSPNANIHVSYSTSEVHFERGDAGMYS